MAWLPGSIEWVPVTFRVDPNGGGGGRDSGQPALVEAWKRGKRGDRLASRVATDVALVASTVPCTPPLYSGSLGQLQSTGGHTRTRSRIVVIRSPLSLRGYGPLSQSGAWCVLRCEPRAAAGRAHHYHHAFVFSIDRHGRYRKHGMDTGRPDVSV